MKKFVYFLSSTFMLLSCAENLEDNRPALQGFIDGDLYQSIDTKAFRSVDGDLTILGLTNTEGLTIKLSSAIEGTYTLGGSLPNFVKFSRPDGLEYNTNPNGSGQVVLRQLDEANQRIYGSFEFDAVLSGLDTIVVRNGVFFEVPFIQELVSEDPDPEDSEIPDGVCTAGTVVASIDNDHNLEQGADLCITAVVLQNQIVITATDPDEEIMVYVPLDVGVGQNPLPVVGFNATYTDLVTGVTEEAISGNLIVLSHNTNADLIKISFHFITPNHIIESANLNVAYN
jgi:hypothetical protein